MIYLPVEITNNMCAYVYDRDTIRVYESRPQNNRTIAYTDYFINSHYISRTGTTTFNNYSTLNYDCLPAENFSKSVSYRNDLPDILIIALILIGSVWFLISKLIKTLLKGRKRY